MTTNFLTLNTMSCRSWISCTDNVIHLLKNEFPIEQENIILQVPNCLYIIISQCAYYVYYYDHLNGAKLR